MKINRKINKENKVELTISVICVIICIYLLNSIYSMEHEEIKSIMSDSENEGLEVLRLVFSGSIWIICTLYIYFLISQIAIIVLGIETLDYFTCILLVTEVLLFVYLIEFIITRSGSIANGTMVLSTIEAGLIMFILYTEIGIWNAKKKRKEINIEALNIDKRIKRVILKNNIKVYVFPRLIGILNTIPVFCKREEKAIFFTKEEFGRCKRNKAYLESDLWHEIYHLKKWNKKADTELQAEVFEIQKIQSRYGYRRLIDTLETEVISSKEIREYLGFIKERCRALISKESVSDRIDFL